MQDTLVIDSTQLAQWQAQPDFDYNRELVGGEMTFNEWLWMQIGDLLDEIFGKAISTPFGKWILSLLAIAVRIGTTRLIDNVILGKEGE